LVKTTSGLFRFLKKTHSSMTKKKPGFAGKWIEAFSVGSHVGHTIDGTPVTLNVTPDYLNQLATNFDVNLHEPPAVIGHPKHDDPAFGWISGVRVKGDKLELQFADVEPQFEQMVQSGLFKKRSLRLYADAAEAPGGKVPQIRHCGFLGAQPPAVKGLANISLSEADKSVAFEIDGDITFSEGEGMTDAEKKALEEATKRGVLEFLKEKLGFGDKLVASTSFGEADAQRIVDAAVSSVTTKFETEMTALKDENRRLTDAVNSQTGSTARRDVVQFCEEMISSGKLPLPLKDRMVNFMEALASVPEKKVTVIEFSEEGGRQVEKKTESTLLAELQNFVRSFKPYVQFGEGFAQLNVKGDASQIASPGELEAMRREVGLKAETTKA
jgi:hypothetical protein